MMIHSVYNSTHNSRLRTQCPQTTNQQTKTQTQHIKTTTKQRPQTPTAKLQNNNREEVRRGSRKEMTICCTNPELWI